MYLTVVRILFALVATAIIIWSTETQFSGWSILYALPLGIIFSIPGQALTIIATGADTAITKRYKNADLKKTLDYFVPIYNKALKFRATIIYPTISLVTCLYFYGFFGTSTENNQELLVLAFFTLSFYLYDYTDEEFVDDRKERAEAWLKAAKLNATTNDLAAFADLAPSMFELDKNLTSIKHELNEDFSKRLLAKNIHPLRLIGYCRPYSTYWSSEPLETDWVFHITLFYMYDFNEGPNLQEGAIVGESSSPERAASIQSFLAKHLQTSLGQKEEWIYSNNADDIDADSRPNPQFFSGYGSSPDKVVHLMKQLVRMKLLINSDNFEETLMWLAEDSAQTQQMLSILEETTP